MKCPSMLNTAPQSVPIRRIQHGEQLCKMLEAATAEASFSLHFLLDKCFIVPQILSQPNGGVHQLLCWISIRLRGWFPPWSLSSRREQEGLWLHPPPQNIFCLLRYLIRKDSSQSVIERWVKWSTAARFLGSFAWWGEVGHRCQFLHRQADALHTRDAFLSISPSNQCNLCLVIFCTVFPAGEKNTLKKKHNKRRPGRERKVNQRIRKHPKLWKWLLWNGMTCFCMKSSLAQSRKLHHS